MDRTPQGQRQAAGGPSFAGRLGGPSQTDERDEEFRCYVSARQDRPQITLRLHLPARLEIEPEEVGVPWFGLAYRAKLINGDGYITLYTSHGTFQIVGINLSMLLDKITEHRVKSIRCHSGKRDPESEEAFVSDIRELTDDDAEEIQNHRSAA